jgi:hypothetical protein
MIVSTSFDRKVRGSQVRSRAQHVPLRCKVAERHRGSRRMAPGRIISWYKEGRRCVERFAVVVTVIALGWSTVQEREKVQPEATMTSPQSDSAFWLDTSPRYLDHSAWNATSTGYAPESAVGWGGSAQSGALQTTDPYQGSFCGGVGWEPTGYNETAWTDSPFEIHEVDDIPSQCEYCHIYAICI